MKPFEVAFGATVMLIVVLGGGGWLAYEYFRDGYHTAPRDRPEGSSLLVFTNDRRVVILPEVAVDLSKSRYQHLGVVGAPDYLRRSWTTCRLPTAQEAEMIAAADPRPGSRLEALCELEAEGEVFPMGMLYSVPR